MYSNLQRSFDGSMGKKNLKNQWVSKESNSENTGWACPKCAPNREMLIRSALPNFD